MVRYFQCSLEEKEFSFVMDVSSLLGCSNKADFLVKASNLILKQMKIEGLVVYDEHLNKFIRKDEFQPGPYDVFDERVQL